MRQVIVSGETCGTGSSSVAGLAFYTGSGYPAAYQNALFFADYSRKCVWAMRTGANGLPDTSTVQTITAAAGPVMLTTAPDGDVLYAGFDDDRLHRIRYVGGNLPPTAAIAATPSSGTSPLNVSFTAAASSDPEGQTLTFAWDLDGDGSFDDGTGPTRSWTYTGAAATTITARVLVTDPGGQSAVAATAILLNGTRPTAVIDTPSGSFQWKVGDPIGFSGRGLDPDEPGGQLPAAALQWEVNIHHCPSDCHVHGMQSFNGVASGSFNAPDHEYPSFLELRLTVTDPTGETASASVNIQPQTTTFGVAANVSGLQLVVNGTSQPAPFSRTVIVGSSNSLQAPSPQTLGGSSYAFGSWSDGLAQTHNVVAAATPTTYTATYTTNPSVTQTATFQVAAGADDIYEEGASFLPGDLETWLGNGPAGVTSVTALRFAGVTIPQGAEIVSARLEVNAAATQWNQLAFEIAAEAAGSSTPFGASSLPSQRPLLPARAAHSSDEQWLANTWYAVSTDLAPMLQQVVGQPGWASGNATSLIMRGQGSAWARKRIAAFETAPTRAARIVVTYRATPAGPTLSIGDVTLAEGNSGTTNAVFTVTLSAQPGATPVTVSYATANGTAVAPGDFTATSGSLTFTGTTTTQTVSVPIVGDTTVEAERRLHRHALEPRRRHPARRLRHRHDHQRRCRAGADAVDRRCHASPKATAARPPPSSRSRCRLNPVPPRSPSARHRERHRRRPRRLHRGDRLAHLHPRHHHAQTVSVTIVGDTTVEPNEDFTVTLTNPAGATLLDGSATGTITNDDVAPLPTLSIGDVTHRRRQQRHQHRRLHGDAVGSTRRHPRHRQLRHRATAPPSPPETSPPATGSLTFTGTTTSQTIPIAIVGDTTLEATETFTVTLTQPHWRHPARRFRHRHHHQRRRRRGRADRHVPDRRRCRRRAGRRHQLRGDGQLDVGRQRPAARTSMSRA